MCVCICCTFVVMDSPLTLAKLQTNMNPNTGVRVADQINPSSPSTPGSTLKFPDSFLSPAEVIMSSGTVSAFEKYRNHWKVGITAICWWCGGLAGYWSDQCCGCSSIVGTIEAVGSSQCCNSQRFIIKKYLRNYIFVAFSLLFWITIWKTFHRPVTSGWYWKTIKARAQLYSLLFPMNAQDYFLQDVLKCHVQRGLNKANYRNELATFWKSFEITFPFH